LQIQHLEYQHQDTVLEGFCAFDPAHGQQQPLVIIAHTWAGRDEFVCDKARELAKLGYVGFAVDFYGKGIVGKNKDENLKLVTPFLTDRAFLYERFLAGLEAAKQVSVVNPKQVAAIGFCFGGLCVLDLARQGTDIKGVVSFHGLLNAPENWLPLSISAKVLVLHGYEDPMATPDHVLAFCQEMRLAKADWQLHAYGNTLHAFTNPHANDPDFGTVYSPTADKRSWGAMKSFLKEVFSA
jgi:dienelactone hydrolase